MTMTAKANVEMRQVLDKLLGEDHNFSEKGLHYLACRMLGSKYRKAISVAINAMREGRLQQIIPEELKTKVADAFGYEKDVPDQALVIIGTGRKAILSKKGWDESGVSLFNIPPLPTEEEFQKFEEKMQEKMLKQYEIRFAQKEACSELMELFNQETPVVEEPETIPVVEEPEVKKAEVIQLDKKKAAKTKKPKVPVTS